MTDTELFNLIDEYKPRKLNFKLSRSKEQKKVLQTNCMILCPHFQTRTAEALSCSVYMKTRGSK